MSTVNPAIAPVDIPSYRIVAPTRVASVRAALRPGTVVVVRDHQSVQVGLAPDRAVVVNAPAACGPHRLVALLTGLKGGAVLDRAAARAGVGPGDLPQVARILIRLADLGHVDLDSHGTDIASPEPTPRPDPIRRVYILGTGQLSEVLRGPIAVNGCRVATGPHPGLTLDPHRPPWHRHGPPNDLVILTGTVAVDPVVTTALTRAGQAHLHVHCRDGRVVVGPTVVPGATPCLRCTDLFRTRRDPRWPFVAAQLIDHAPDAGVPALTAAAALVLSEIAATRIPGAPLQTIGATVEINPAEGLWRRLEWPAVPDCDCGAAAEARPLS